MLGEMSALPRTGGEHDVVEGDQALLQGQNLAQVGLGK